MPNFNVYLEHDAMVLGRTRMVLVPFEGNPVTATDGPAAIGIAATAVGHLVENANSVEGVYVAVPPAGATRKQVEFSLTPSVSDVPIT